MFGNYKNLSGDIMYIFRSLVERTLATALLLLPLNVLLSQEVVIRTPSGNSLTLEIDTTTSFNDILQEIETQLYEIDDPLLYEHAKPILIDFSGSATPCKATYKGQSVPRNFAVQVTPAEKKDMRKLLTSMAKNTWAELLSNSSSMNKIGDRIEHIHPLRFLQCIFSDEELKGCLHSVKDRSIIWKKFFSGVSESLEEEANRNNMKPEFIQEFAASLNLNPNLIKDSIEKKKWKEFLDILFKNLPRDGNQDRHDM
jgi:hypothetical protein